MNRLNRLKQTIVARRMTLREVRTMMDPRLQAVPYLNQFIGLPDHPNNPLWSTYVNKLQIVSLLDPNKLKETFG